MTENRYQPAQYSERQYQSQQVDTHQHPQRFAEVDISRDQYQGDYNRQAPQVNVDISAGRQQGTYEYQAQKNTVYDRVPHETQLDITEREYRRRVQPTYEVEYERRRPVRDDIVVENKVVTEVRTEKPQPRGKMGYYDDHGEYHSFRRGVERAADRIFHPFHGRSNESVVIDEGGPSRVSEGRVENVRFVQPTHAAAGQTVTIPCHFIRVGDLVMLQGRPSQVIRISQSSSTGQYRYLGVDLFTRQLHEESSFQSNPEPSVYVQSMLGPVFKQYRILDLRADGQIVCMTETGDVKQGLPVVDQGGLYNKIAKSFDDGRGSVRALVINDGGRELIVDYKVIHGSRL